MFNIGLFLPSIRAFGSNPFPAGRLYPIHIQSTRNTPLPQITSLIPPIVIPYVSRPRRYPAFTIENVGFTNTINSQITFPKLPRPI
jgi:hypothetical protein